MALPTDDDLRHALMRLIGKQPGYNIASSDAYALLEAQFPSLTWEETHVPYGIYGSDRSEFQNRVRRAVQHLRADDWISKLAGHGRWEFTAKGRARWNDAFPDADDMVAELAMISTTSTNERGNGKAAEL